MSVAADRLPMSDVWERWEGHIVGGSYPLRRYLGGSDHGGVFLTEYAPLGVPNAALKLVPAIPTLAQSQLAHWRTAAAATHPHLVRCFEVGRCQLGEQHFLFFVMEYAEQNLGQLLRHRAMTEPEAREMLLASLDALGFLHSLNLVQGQFKPANVLVVGDQLKLASDTIRPAGESNASISMASPYDPPEARAGSFSAAGDLWAVGITTFEALMRTRAGSDAELPADFPPTLAEIVRRCLNPNPASRPKAREVEGWLKHGLPAAKEQPGPVEKSVASAASVRTGSAPARLGAGAAEGAGATAQAGVAAGRVGGAPTRLVIRAAVRRDPPAPPPKPPAQMRRFYVPMLIVAIVAAAVGWFVTRAFTDQGNSVSRTVSASTSTGTAATAESAASEPSRASSAAAFAQGAAGVSTGIPAKAVGASASAGDFGVVHAEIPAASASARATIRGHIKVSVLVSIGSGGVVTGAKLIDSGPSRYFARLALQAARKWRFEPGSGSREHVLRFEFAREGSTGHVVR